MGIGSVLLDRGLVTREQLEDALAEQRTSGERLDRVLVRRGIVRRDQVLDAIGGQFHMPVVDLGVITPEPKVLEALPATLVYKQNCVPIARSATTLTVATSDPFELAVLDELRLLTGCSIELVLADEDELHKFIRAHYGVGGDTLDQMSGLPEAAPAADAHDEVEQAQEASVIKLVNDIIAEAIKDRATDVHIEPYERELTVRYRIDGVLQRANVPPAISRFGPAIISRLKIMASLNISEKRKPQDGRITFRDRALRGSGGGEYDLRLSIIPMLHGEGVVLRILSKTTVVMGLADLGMPAHVLATWDGLINKPHGILLVTGPTGSGKSTTLYASLARITSDEVKVITVEDPVEYHVKGVNQIQVNHKVGLDFAAGLRSVLRHDPDVVMIGEIRDKETAETAVQASLTGHLVFSTLHTNDSAGATTRLLDMGVEPFLVASSVEGIMAQRLVRRVCRHCAAPYIPDAADVPDALALRPGETLVRGGGCKECRSTGYLGRIGIYELMLVDDALREMIMHRASAPTIATRAQADSHLWPMRDDGFAKTRAGVTTIAEVMRAMKA
ncbi:MAG: Flp pilus assembly complex ATPase component TadA [Phycisphaerales bacterium]|nr:Flp pilus assembly complex ATPase component TadA [Phycisphaerales bacterium]